MNKLTIDSCPLCRCSRLEHAMKCKDFYVSGEEFELMKCTSCGFLFTQHPPVEAEIGAYYETPDYVSHSDTRKGLMNKIYHQVREQMLVRKAKLINQVTGKTSGRLLDIGAGTGYFANTMQQQGWEVEAVEKSEQARLFAKTHFDLEILEEGALADFDDKAFDVITLWHVMEHLEQINETWERLSRLLTDDGVLVVALPNCKSYDARRYGAHWAAYDVPRHLWHFTPSTIQQFGNKHGFILTAQFPMPFDGFYVSILSERYKRHYFSFVRGMIAGGIGWMQSLSKREKSSSIIYIFRKK